MDDTSHIHSKTDVSKGLGATQRVMICNDRTSTGFRRRGVVRGCVLEGVLTYMRMCSLCSEPCR